MSKYSDYIKLQKFLAVYDIKDEGKNNLWQSFIPTRQFSELMQHSLTAMTSPEAGKRKAMWVRGTFGTGKSHASSVVRHLLCDPLEEIESYLDKFENPSLKEQIRNFRQGKRYFCVVLKGVEGAYDIPRMTLSIQKATKDALKAAGFDNIAVKSDFESAVKWINENDSFINAILEENDDLAIIAPNKEALLKKLETNDLDTFIRLSNALNEKSVYLNSDSISDWLVETEQEMEKKGMADGLIVMWDEFTSVMDTIKGDRINVLQNIAEKAQQNNVFLYLISHRVESQSSDTRGKDITKMNDRFDSINYEMDQISTYLIMRHTYGRQPKVSAEEYNKFQFGGTEGLSDLLTYLCQNNSEERKHMRSLFPIHPYTAYLCSVLSSYIGSSNRSVLMFMNDEKNGFGKFIEIEGLKNIHQLLTAEWLWDFFYQKFEDDTMCAPFTATYVSMIDKVRPLGDDYVRVFKSVLLLNALSNKFSGERGEGVNRLAPSEKNIALMFAEDRAATNIAEILQTFDDRRIIQRDIFGEFKIAVTGIDPNLLEQQRKNIRQTYSDAESILNFNLDEKTKLQNVFKAQGQVNETGELYRVCDVQLYSCETAEPMLRSKLNRYMGQKPNYLHIAIFLAQNEESRDMAENRIRTFATEFKNSILILPYETISTEYCNKFVEAVAVVNVAQSMNNEKLKEENTKTAKKYISEWMNRMNQGSYTMYFNGEMINEGVFGKVCEVINKKVSPKVYPLGFEAIKQYRSGTSGTFFKKGNSPSLVINVLQAQTRDQLLRFGGQDIPAKHIFQDGQGSMHIDDNCGLTKDAIADNVWITQICDKVDECMLKAKKLYNDRFSLSEVLEPLMLAPYGFFPTRPFWVALPFALRKYKADLYDPKTSQPVSDEKLADILKELFKQWDNGDSSNNAKTFVRFGSLPEKHIKESLIDIFELDKLVNRDEIKSYDLAKYYVQEFCKQKAQYPLWTLLYCDNCTESIKEIVQKLISMFDTDGRPTEDKFKNVYESITSNNVNLRQLLLNTNNYGNGFQKFVKSIPDIEIKDEWWNELLQEMGFINSNKEIAFIKESDAKSKIFSFFIQKTKPTIPPTQPQTPVTPPIAPTPTAPKPTPNPDRVKIAKERTKQMTMPNMMWQKFVLDLIEDHPEISDFVSEYFKD